MIRKVAIIGPESTGKSTLCAQLAAHYQTLWVPEYAREYLETNGTAYSYDTLLDIAKGQVGLEEKYLERLSADMQVGSSKHSDNPDSTFHTKSSMNPGSTDLPDKPGSTTQTTSTINPTSGYNHSTSQPNNTHLVESNMALNQAHPLLFIDTEMYVMKVWSEFVFRKCHQWIIDQAADRQYDLYLLCNIDLPWIYDALREYPTPEPRQQLFNMYHDIMVNQPVPWVVIKGDYEQRLSTAVAAINRIL